MIRSSSRQRRCYVHSHSNTAHLQTDKIAKDILLHGRVDDIQPFRETSISESSSSESSSSSSSETSDSSTSSKELTTSSEDELTLERNHLLERNPQELLNSAKNFENNCPLNSYLKRIDKKILALKAPNTYLESAEISSLLLNACDLNPYCKRERVPINLATQRYPHFRSYLDNSISEHFSGSAVVLPDVYSITIQPPSVSQFSFFYSYLELAKIENIVVLTSPRKPHPDFFWENAQTFDYEYIRSSHLPQTPGYTIYTLKKKETQTLLKIHHFDHCPDEIDHDTQDLVDFVLEVNEQLLQKNENDFFALQCETSATHSPLFLAALHYKRKPLLKFSLIHSIIYMRGQRFGMAHSAKSLFLASKVLQSIKLSKKKRPLVYKKTFSY